MIYIPFFIVILIDKRGVREAERGGKRERERERYEHITIYITIYITIEASEREAKEASG